MVQRNILEGQQALQADFRVTIGRYRAMMQKCIGFEHGPDNAHGTEGQRIDAIMSLILTLNLRSKRRAPKSDSPSGP
jgi:hypothetical protein